MFNSLKRKICFSVSSITHLRFYSGSIFFERNISFAKICRQYFSRDFNRTGSPETVTIHF